MQTLTQLADAVENALAEDADQETLDAIAALVAGVRAAEQSGEAVAIARRDYDDDAMWEWIDTRARETLRHHHTSVRGQQITRFDAADSHIAAAAIEWADSHPLQTNQQPAPGVPYGFALEDCRSLPEPEIRVHERAIGWKWCAVRPVDGYVYNLLCAMLAAAPQPDQQLPSVVDEIAQQWDGCIYDSPSGDIDIGWAIRAAGKRLMGEKPKEGGK